MKKYFNLTIILFSGLAFAFAIIIHLMYGSCQTSKLHYMVQCYYVPKIFPHWMWVSNFRDYLEDGNVLEVYKNYSGKWYYWDKVGGKVEYNFINSELNGLVVFWNKNRIKIYEAVINEGQIIGIEKCWYDNGNKKSVKEYKLGKEISAEEWNIDGTKK